MLEITGKIIALLDTKEGVSKRTGNKYMLQEFVLETVEQYPQKAQFTLFGEDKIKHAALKGGDNVTVTFTLNAAESKGRWYNSLNAFNVIKHDEQPMSSAQTEVPAPTSVVAPEDDLPF